MIHQVWSRQCESESNFGEVEPRSFLIVDSSNNYNYCFICIREHIFKIGAEQWPLSKTV